MRKELEEPGLVVRLQDARHVFEKEEARPDCLDELGHEIDKLAILLVVFAACSVCRRESLTRRSCAQNIDRL
jgi:hypothetical protein